MYNNKETKTAITMKPNIDQILINSLIALFHIENLLIDHYSAFLLLESHG